MQPLQALELSDSEALGEDTTAEMPAAEILPADNPEPTAKGAPIPCQGLGFHITDDKSDWRTTYRVYANYIEGGEKSSTKFGITIANGVYTCTAAGCTGIGKKGWKHKVVCCSLCHAARVDKDQVVKNALNRASQINIALDLLGKGDLSKPDKEFLQHAILERPLVYGNMNFAKLKDIVKVRLLAHERKGSLPQVLQCWEQDGFLKAFVKAAESGNLPTLEQSMVYHMMLNFLQSLDGNPSAKISSKLFAFCRALRCVSRSSYEFFRTNTLVGPHVKYIQEVEAGVKDAEDVIVDYGASAMRKRFDKLHAAYALAPDAVFIDGRIPVHAVINDTRLVAALEPNFHYKLVFGGPAPDFHFLPWPHLMPEKGYKLLELQSSWTRSCANMVKISNHLTSSSWLCLSSKAPTATPSPFMWWPPMLGMWVQIGTSTSWIRSQLVPISSSCLLVLMVIPKRHLGGTLL